MKRLIVLSLLLVSFISASSVQAAGFPVSFTEMLDATSKLKSLEYDLDFGMNFEAGSGVQKDSFYYNIDASGKVIRSKQLAHSMAATLTVGGMFAATSGYNDPLAGIPLKLTLGIESVFVKKTLYLALKKLSLEPSTLSDEVGDIEEIVKKLKNVWIKISAKELSEYADSEALDDASKESIIEALQSLEEIGIITFTRQAEETTVNGKTVRKYNLTVSEAQLQALIQSTISDPYERQSMQELFDSLNISTIVVWVDENTKLPVKYSGTVNMNMVDTYETMNANIQIDMTIKKVNSVKSIKAPKKAKSIDAILESLYADSYGSARKKAEDAAIKSSLSILRSYAEMHLDQEGSYKNLCASSTVDEYFDSINDQSDVTPGCTEAKDGKSYLMYSALVNESGYFCVDSWGNSKVQSAKPRSGATTCSK